jgi:hypothetical protein
VKPEDSHGEAARDAKDKPVVLGGEMARASEADAIHRREHPEPSPLAGVEYAASRREFDLFRLADSPTDDVIRRFLERYVDPAERVRARSALTMDDFYTLLTFASRCALSGVRAREGTMVRLGLAALSMIDSARVDWRDATLAAALLSYAAGRAEIDSLALFAAEAATSEPTMARILGRFDREPVVNLMPWGHREISTEGGVVLASDDGRPYVPTRDLFSISMEFVELLESDVWRVSDVKVGAAVPAVWLQRSKTRAAVSALRRLRACTQVSAKLLETASPDAPSQMLLVFLAEALNAKDARTLAESAGPDKRVESFFVGFGLNAAELCAIVVSRSFVQGVESYENSNSLERFRSGMAAILSKHIRE